METAAYFVQECPTCGKRMQIRSQYLGMSLTCPNCMDQFVACDETSEDHRFTPSSGNLCGSMTGHEFQELTAGSQTVCR